MYRNVCTDIDKMIQYTHYTEEIDRTKDRH